MRRKIFLGLTILLSLPALSCSSANLRTVDTHSSGNEKYNDIKQVITILNTQMDRHFKNELDQLTDETLMEGYGLYSSDQVIEYADSKQSKTMSLEYTLRLFDENFESFISKIPPNDWGLYLNNLIGRGISNVMYDDEGRVVQQVERMILKSFPLNMDMTKAEIIEYGPEQVAVYWRVFRSENKSTLSDVGSIFFNKKGDKTLVTFRSAHQLGGNPLFNLPLPNIPLLQKKIRDTFLKHLESYQRRLSN